MKVQKRFAGFCVPLLVAALLSANLSAQPQQTGSQHAPSGVTIDPSAGPLQPSGTPPANAPNTSPLPEAPQPVASAPPSRQSSQPPAQAGAQQPLGAAATEQVKTAGGGASRPAGNAIAPVKQHQYRSLVIKLGAVAAAVIATGAVYGLSRATPSTPPHSASAAAK
jgi:hypothetical protein